MEITVPQGKNILVGSVYRPPNYNIASFVDILSNISKDNKQCNEMGDFNLDLLRVHSPLKKQIVTVKDRGK